MMVPVMFTVFPNPRGVSFRVKVVPGASKTSLAGLEGDFLKIRLSAAPVDGKANEALVEFLARKLNLKKSSVAIRAGWSSRKKIVQVDNCTEQRLRDLIAKCDSP
jgi:hypothetical protein